MTRWKAIFFTTLLLIACSNPTVQNTDSQATEIIATELTLQNKSDTVQDHLDKIQTEDFPIRGELTQKQIDKYYPNIIDTIKDRRIIGSESISVQTETGIYVSLLHNVGTSDQKFLCTHDKSFKLIDSYYVGTSTMFDKSSHTIEHNKLNDEMIEFHHVDWGTLKMKQTL